MSNQTIGISDLLNEYIRKVSVNETPQLKALREITMTMAEKNMQISPEQGQFMSLLVNLLGARKILEIGVFTGYSTLSMAKELPSEGEVIACDVSTEWTDIGKKYWQEAGVEEKISLRIAPATQTLEELLAEGFSDSFDIVFIDADKANYMVYYQKSLELLKPGGLILIDNTLWSGTVADPSNQSEDTVAIRELNTYIAADARVQSSLLPVSDGLTLVRKI